eukprot:3430218-Amphidinium_carterae.3
MELCHCPCSRSPTSSRFDSMKVTYPHPAFGEMVGGWTSQDKKKAKALDPRGSVGRFLSCDTWWTVAVTALASLWTVMLIPNASCKWYYAS